MPESRHRRRRGRALPRTARSSGSLADARPRKKKTNKLYLAASVVIAVLVIAGFAVGGFRPGGGGGDRVSTGSSDEFVSGVGLQQELMPVGPSGRNTHVSENQTVVYSTVPATSGDHWGLWAPCGFHEDGLPDERITHNLEHGNIVISYNLTELAEVQQLREAVQSISLYQDWGLTRFYDKIPEGTVALATWGVLDTIEGIDRDRMDRFFETYAGRLGPEEIPCGFSPLRVNPAPGG